MAHALINTLEYVNILTEVGFSQREAQGLNKAQMMATQAILSQVATQENLKDLCAEMHDNFKDVRGEIKDLRAEMHDKLKDVRAEIKDVEHRLHKEISEIKPFVLKAIITSSAANIAAMGVMISLFKLF